VTLFWKILCLEKQPTVRGWALSGWTTLKNYEEGWLAFGYANLRGTEGKFRSRNSPLRSNPELRRGSRPCLKRHHPSPGIPTRDDGGESGTSPAGALFFVFMVIGASRGFADVAR